MRRKLPVDSPKPSVSPKLCRNSKTMSRSEKPWPVSFKPEILGMVKSSVCSPISESSSGFLMLVKVKF